MDTTQPDSTTFSGPSGTSTNNVGSNEAFRISKSKENQQRKPVDWQNSKENLSQRGQYLLETGIWSDCTFVVGLPPTLRVSTKSSSLDQF